MEGLDCHFLHIYIPQVVYFTVAPGRVCGYALVFFPDNSLSPNGM